jgi:cytochrome bd-type quinol oxidase subunit 2
MRWFHGHTREFDMRRFSRLFWFTVFAGSLSSPVIFGAALRIFTAHMNGMDALCRQGKPDCSWESVRHLYYVACTAHVTGTLASFGLAYIIGRSFIKPAATDATA